MGVLTRVSVARAKALGLEDLSVLQPSVLSGLGDVKRRSRAALLRLYEDHHWLRLGANVVAARYSAASWFLVRPSPGLSGRRIRSRLALSKAWERRDLMSRAIKQGDLVEPAEHPFLTMLASGTTGAPPWLSLSGHEVDKLERSTIDFVGEWVQILFRDPVFGHPIRWWPVPPTWVDPPSQRSPSFEIRIRSGRPLPIPPEDVAWYRVARLSDPYSRGTGTGGTLDHETQIDENEATYLAALLKNRARPDLLMLLPGAGRTELEQMQENWNADLQGSHKAGLAHFLSFPLPAAAGARAQPVIQDLNKSPADLGIAESRRLRRDVFLQVWGVPPDVIGATESSNRATAFQAEKNLRRNRLVPDWESRRNWLQCRFFEPMGGREPEYPGGWIVGYRPPRLDDVETKTEIIKSASHALPHNAILRAAGEDPVEGGDDLYFVPNTVTPLTLAQLRGGRLEAPEE